mmetsp:Transcript_57727/g.114525  ORF Transcript_57727/g.114525 Transcript_57727/m.114525 type:complete len:326 (-) Transcript_57727:333-1310(-)
MEMLSLGGDTKQSAGEQRKSSLSPSRKESELEPDSTDASDGATVMQKLQQLQHGLSQLQAGHTRLVSMHVKMQLMEVQVAEYVEKRINEHVELWQRTIAEEIQRKVETKIASFFQWITEKFEEQSNALQCKGTAVLSKASTQKSVEDPQRLSLKARNATSSPLRERLRPTAAEPRAASVRGAAAIEPDDGRCLGPGACKVSLSETAEDEEQVWAMSDKLQSCVQRISTLEERFESASTFRGVEQSSLAELERLERAVAGALTAKSEASSPRFAALSNSTAEQHLPGNCQKVRAGSRSLQKGEELRSPDTRRRRVSKERWGQGRPP